MESYQVEARGRCRFAGKTSCCQFEFVQQAATDLEYCGNQNNNQIRKELA